MTDRNDEDFLREAFDALDRHERRRVAAPDFDAMLARARAETSRDTVAGPEEGDAPPVRVGGWARPERWLSLAAAAAVATLLLADGSGRADREFERVVTSYSEAVAAGALRSPTDGLLSTPGLDLGAVPTFGTSLGLPSGRGDATGSGRDS